MTFQSTAPSTRSLGDALHRLGHRWGWVVGFGVLSVILGLLALELPLLLPRAACLTSSENTTYR